MQEKHHSTSRFVQKSLPWIIAAAALVIYAVTLNRWVSLGSLPLAAQVTGLDWGLPHQAPLLHLLTFPLRALPAAWQPLALNFFAAVCAALALGLLARSVVLLPHDRTHDQRLRERSEFSLLSIPSAWLPPAFAVLVCGLQLTFWEHATAGTGELLNLLLFAYVIRCLLEYRIDPRDSWLTGAALVFGLGITNDYAMLGFLPVFLVALIWIRGWSFFQFRFLSRMAAFGVLGLSLYLLLPLAWAMSDSAAVGFWEALKSNLAAQKAMLFDVPALRSRALILSLTSLVPLLILGIRWPSSFGDTSAAGTMVTNLMFRVIHIALLIACVAVTFDLGFSPRQLGFGIPFLTFYYLGALCIGYFAGYILLVFGGNRSSKAWKRESPAMQVLNRGLTGLVWIASLAVPIALAYQNAPIIWEKNGSLLRDFTAQWSEQIPERPSVILSDDGFSLLLLQAHLPEASRANYIFLHTGSLRSPDYHRHLAKHYGARWQSLPETLTAGGIIDDGLLLQLVIHLSQNNEVYYLHPSFGFYFERFDAEPHGLVSKLVPYPDQTLAQPALPQDLLLENEAFWNRSMDRRKALDKLAAREIPEARYISSFYSRALNNWAVRLQRDDHLDDAADWFRTAAELNPNNIPALVNSEYNRTLRTGESRETTISKTIENKFGIYRNWEAVLRDNGAFDHPEFCLTLGKIFLSQGLTRQAATQFTRVRTFEPNNPVPRVALATVYLQRQNVDEALREVADLRGTAGAAPLNSDLEVELIRVEALAYAARNDFKSAEKVLLDMHQRQPSNAGVLDILVQLYSQTGRHEEALGANGKLIQLAPDNPQVWFNQASLHTSQQDYAKALDSLDHVLKKNPDDPAALLNKVFVRIQMQDYKGALEETDKVLSKEADNVEALLYAGVIHLQEQGYDKALVPLNRALRLQPDNWNALRNRALAHLQRGAFNDARQDYQKLVKLMPGYHVPYYGLAEIAYQQKDIATAMRNYELYLQHAPNVESPDLVAERELANQRLQELKLARQ